MSFVIDLFNLKHLQHKEHRIYPQVVPHTKNLKLPKTTNTTKVTLLLESLVYQDLVPITICFVLQQYHPIFLSLPAAIDHII